MSGTPKSLFTLENIWNLCCRVSVSKHQIPRQSRAQSVQTTLVGSRHTPTPRTTVETNRIFHGDLGYVRRWVCLCTGCNETSNCHLLTNHIFHGDLDYVRRCACLCRGCTVTKLATCRSLKRFFLTRSLKIFFLCCTINSSN